MAMRAVGDPGYDDGVWTQAQEEDDMGAGLDGSRQAGPTGLTRGPKKKKKKKKKKQEKKKRKRKKKTKKKKTKKKKKEKKKGEREKGERRKEKKKQYFLMVIKYRDDNNENDHVQAGVRGEGM